MRYYKVDLVIATDDLNQSDLIDLFWYWLTSGMYDLKLVQNIVYKVDAADWEV